MSSSAAFCCTPCRTASIASATTASSPMAPAATTSPVVVGCSMPVILVPASLPTIIRKAIDRSPQPTSPSVTIAAAPCGGSQPYRAPLTLNRSAVTHHDSPADAHRDYTRNQRCRQQCLHRHHAADQSLHRECRPFQPWRLTQSRRSALERRPSAQTNRLLLAAADPTPPATATSLGHYPHSARSPAASFNPASMRSRSTPRPSLDLAARPHRTLRFLKSGKF